MAIRYGRYYLDLSHKMVDMITHQMRSGLQEIQSALMAISRLLVFDEQFLMLDGLARPCYAASLTENCKLVLFSIQRIILLPTSTCMSTTSNL